MIKKTLCTLITFCLLISAVPAASAAAADSSDTHIITSNCPDNYMDLKIQGSKLVVTGVLSTGFDSAFSAMIGVESGKKSHLTITPGKKFSTEISLGSVTKPVSFQIYTGPEEIGTYWGYIWHSIYIEPDGDGGYRFCTSPVLANNLEKESYWINPADCLGSGVSGEMQALSDSIVKNAKSDYEKVFLLYKWVVDNIYYDYDALYRGTSTTYTASSILTSRRSVCEGYANILQSLIQAQGIPCIKVTTYALGAGTTGEWDDDSASETVANHAHNEAFVDGRWIVMDATWDSNNKYENGEYHAKAANCFLYFDITPEVFAGNHKIISRPRASQQDTPSSWAQEEVIAAIGKGFVPASLQSGYRSSITRGEFCRLIMEMLCRKSSMHLHEFLGSKQIALDPKAFTDTSDEYILAAYALGIVNGRGNGLFAPQAYITRQEAAAMLARAAKAAGISSANCEALSFADSDKFASWAADSIAFITALSGSSGARVMGGTGNNMFSPLDAYTREQSIMTVLRLYECL